MAKKYFISKIIGNAEYDCYVPHEVSVYSMSEKFLCAVSKYNILLVNRMYYP